MKKGKVWLCVALVAVLLFLAWLFLPSSSTVYIHSSGTEARTITLSGALFHFRTAEGTLWAFPVRHGPHVVCLQYADGETVWAAFFSSDVGECHRIDVFVERKANGKTITFRQTINQKDTVFTGGVKSVQTTAEKPYTLDWI